MKKEQGFTLIELLVVIAIIGILAAMVITNLRTARQKARDASALTSMSSARAEAENFYDENGLDYSGVCTAGTFSPGDSGTTNFDGLMIAAANANGNVVTCDVGTTGQTYFAHISLSATGDIFCVDSTGFAGKVAAAPAAGGDCQ